MSPEGRFRSQKSTPNRQAPATVLTSILRPAHPFRRLTMTSYLPYDVQSLLPRSHNPVSNLPSPGDAAPTSLSVTPGLQIDYAPSDEPKPFSAPGEGAIGTLVAFPRHCGCPFAEKEMKRLREVAERDGQVQIVVVSHAPLDVAQEWFKSVAGNSFPNPSRLHILSSPDLSLSNAWGIGVLTWGTLFSLRTFTTLFSLKQQENIANRTTGAGSWRFANSGGFAVDRGGKVRWVHKASEASDMAEYSAAYEALKSAKSEA